MLVLSGVVLADATETGKVNQITISSNSGKNFVSIYLDGPNDNSDCSGGKRWTIDKSIDPLFDEKYSVILAAASSEKQITLLQNTGCDTWSSNKVSEVSVTYY